MEQAAKFVWSIEKPSLTVTAHVDQRRAENIQRNREVLKSIARAVLFCGKQCLALRGHEEDSSRPGNHRNFLALIQLLAINDDVLRKHLESPAVWHTTYLSPRIQNELIDVMGKHITYSKRNN